VRSRWLDIGKDKKKERGQYQAILNEQVWSIKHLYGKEHYFLAGHSRGDFHSTKNSEIFETGTNGMTISRERSQKIRKFFNFRKAKYSTGNSGHSGMKIKWNGNFQDKMLENLSMPHEVVLFFGNYANSQFSIQR